MEQCGISKFDLKRKNRMFILNLLKAAPTCRIDISNTLKITRAAVTIIANEMIEQGVIFELGEQRYIDTKTPKGRKKILLDINQNYKFPLGVSIDEHRITLGISTLKGIVVDKKTLQYTNFEKAETILDFIVSNIETILKDNCLTPERILGLGVAVHPSMHTTLNIPSNKDGSPNFNLLQRTISERTGLTCVVENAVSAIAVAMTDFVNPNLAALDNFVILHYGDMFNFVNVVNGEPVPSASSYTNILENMIVNPNGAEGDIDYPRGSVYNELTEAAIVKKAAAVFSKERTPMLYEMTNGRSSEITMERICEATKLHDSGTEKINVASARLMAVFINNIYCTTNPAKIFLHNINIIPNELNLFKIIINETCGEKISEITEISKIDTKSSFLGGCAIATRELFYKRGGYNL